MWKKIILSVACAVFIIGCLYGVISERTKKGTDAQGQAAISTAKNWLSLIDQHRYKQAWETSATRFKSKFSMENWQSRIVQVRNPRIRISDRQLATVEYRSSLPRAPAGEYFVLVFDVAFHRYSPAHETLVMIKDVDGNWRPTGYYLDNGYVAHKVKAPL